jgi:hypothetical protein
MASGRTPSTRAAGGLGGRTLRFLPTVLLALVSSCSLRQPLPQPPNVSVPAVSGSDINRLVVQQREREDRLNSMRTQAVMEYSDGHNRLKTREQITIRRPGNIRIETLSAFGPSLVLAASSTRVQIFEPGQNLLLNGDASMQALDRFVRIPMAPKSAVRMLLGLAPGLATAFDKPVSVRNEKDMTVLVYPGTGDGGEELGFSGDRLTMVRRRADQGGVRYEVRYSDYRDIGGLLFAHRIEADFPLAGSHVRFDYQRPIVNEAFPDSLFVLKPAPSTRQLDLDQARPS